MDRRTFLATSGAAAIATGLAPTTLLAQAGDAGLNATFDAIFNEALQENPELASSLGLDKGPNAALRGRLGDNSLASQARDLARTKAAIARLEKIDGKTLSPPAALNRDVVLYSLRNQAVGPDKFKLGSPIRPFRISQQTGAYFSVPDFLNSGHVIETAADAEAYLSRLDQFAIALDQDSEVFTHDRARVVVAPGFSLDLALGQMAALRKPAAGESGLTESLVRRTGAKGIAGDWGPRAEKIVAGRVYPALDRQMALVKAAAAKGRTSAGVWDIPQGADIYAAALAISTTTDLTPDAVHKMGIEQVAEISAQIDTILKAQGMSQGSIGARLTALNKDAAQLYPNTAEGRTTLIAGLNEGIKDMMARLPRAFATIPPTPLEIRAVPVEIQDGASNGYYRRASLDGKRPAIYFINLKDVGDWPKYSLPSLTYHEGVPGHHLQNSIALLADTPMIRKIGGFGSYGEGWALYSEGLADELGAYKTPLERAGYLQSFLFRAARLVVDTGIHTQKWSREKATAYLVETTGFAAPRSQREVERYCIQPGQACSYKIGHTSWVRAREKAKAMLGDKFDLKRFHEVLRDGSLPLTILERRVEERARGIA